ncbi:hypothetical protein HY385_01355 [Candidatus Daviesbacteria bacterium]|nr:hypothetical protein [Candidatus Daviesbacteria bacterium]
MSYLWDYALDKIGKTASGKTLILERKINYGLSGNTQEKIKLSEVKKNWSKLHLQPRKKRLFELLIWGR